MEQDFIKAMRFRHACKKFNPQKPIEPEIFENILESGRLAPSSFGMEPTRLLIMRDRIRREQLKALCWNQDQITDASEVVVYLVKIADMQSTSNYALECFKRKGLSEEKIKAYKDERYANFLRANGYVDTQSIFSWGARQAYITAGMMMACAANMGVDSCAIEGFEKRGVEEFLGLDTFANQVALIMCFGYRVADPAKQSPRVSMNEFVRYL